jgi:hypothetical protein
MKIWKKDIFKNVQNENIRKVFFSENVKNEVHL